MKDIQPITFVHGLADVNYIGIVCEDNLKDMAYLTYTLYNKMVISADGDTPEFTNVVQIYSGKLTLGGTDYSAWTGDNTYPYTYVASQLGLTII